MFQTPSLNRPEASFRCYLQANPGSAGTAPFDDWLYEAHDCPSPARTTLTRDSTLYATEPTDRSWIDRINGQQSPTRLTGASGVIRVGTTP